MGFVVVGYVKIWLWQCFMFCMVFVGLGIVNFLMLVVLVYVNCFFMFLLCGDIFLMCLLDLVLQQFENYNDLIFGVNDVFKLVMCFWDCIIYLVQVIQFFFVVIVIMLDLVDCGFVFFGLLQDVQGWIYDYLIVFFEKKVYCICCQVFDMFEIVDVVVCLL